MYKKGRYKNIKADKVNYNCKKYYKKNNQSPQCAPTKNYDYRKVRKSAN